MLLGVAAEKPVALQPRNGISTMSAEQTAREFYIARPFPQESVMPPTTYRDRFRGVGTHWKREKENSSMSRKSDDRELMIYRGIAMANAVALSILSLWLLFRELFR
jgi:hypothetical protein